ncbi:MAG: TonB-dependent receptor [Verrucomicrobia bacterium]|nr:TonB-dependent receptor [Verrucomicrobiota bacterium]
MGGVINIVTKQGAGTPGGSAQFEYGSFGTLLGRTSFAGRTGKASLAADLSYTQSDGDRINSDFSALNLSGRARYDFTESFSAALLVNYLRSDDGTPNDRFTDDPNDRTKNENALIGLTLNADPTSWWNAKATFSYAHENGKFAQPAPNPPFFFGDYASNLLAERWLADFQNIFTPADGHKILLGGTLERSTADYRDTYGALDRAIETYSVYGQYEFTPVERVTLTAGGRVDDNSAFGTHGTYRFGGRFTAPGTETIFRATAGTGFRAPSIAQLYYPGFSNSNLQPEESFGWDAGVEQPLAGGKFRIGATFFHNDFDNLIAGFPPANVSRARTFGVENFATWTPVTNLTLRAAYTWQHTENRETGLTLDRRPEHSGSVGLNWDIVPTVSANVTALFSGPRSDMDYSGWPAARVEMGSYTKLDLGLRWKITKNLEVYGRAENLLGERYEEAYGVPSLGRFFSAGAIVRF